MPGTAVIQMRTSVKGSVTGWIPSRAGGHCSVCRILSRKKGTRDTGQGGEARQLKSRGVRNEVQTHLHDNTPEESVRLFFFFAHLESVTHPQMFGTERDLGGE